MRFDRQHAGARVSVADDGQSATFGDYDKSSGSSFYDGLTVLLSPPVEREGLHVLALEAEADFSDLDGTSKRKPAYVEGGEGQQGLEHMKENWVMCIGLAPPGADTAKSMVQQKGAMVAITPGGPGSFGAAHGMAGFGAVDPRLWYEPGANIRADPDANADQFRLDGQRKDLDGKSPHLPLELIAHSSNKRMKQLLLIYRKGEESSELSICGGGIGLHPMRIGKSAARIPSSYSQFVVTGLAGFTVKLLPELADEAAAELKQGDAAFAKWVEKKYDESQGSCCCVII